MILGLRALRRRLTLIELLLVVAILATVAGGLVVSMGGVEARAEGDLAQHELVELREALLRFRADTGWFPKQGPYALAPAAGDEGPGLVPVPAGESRADYQAWFDSPANLSQLYENPLSDGDPATQLPSERLWDPDRRRGWRGPYLGTPRRVTVGDGLRADGAEAPLGSPAATPDEPLEGTSALDVPALPDPFARPPHELAVPLGGSSQLFVWTGSAGELAEAGRPYFAFDLDDEGRARVVSCGPDGRYTPLRRDAATGEPEAGPAAAGSDDLGLFLLR